MQLELLSLRMKFLSDRFSSYQCKLQPVSFTVNNSDVIESGAV